MNENEQSEDEGNRSGSSAVRTKRNVFRYLSWSHLIWAGIFAVVAYLCFKIANRVDEWNWSHDLSYAFGWMCLVSIIVSCIYLILFQKHSFGASPEDKYDIVDERDKDYEERQRRNSEKR